MTLKQLIYFYEIATVESYTVASKKLYIAQPTLSASVRSLEQELGVNLFLAKGRQIRLTDAGRRFFEYTESFLSTYYRFEQQAYSIEHQNIGTLRLGIPNSIGGILLADMITEFCALYPQIQLTIVSDGARNIQERVEHDDFNFGFAMSPILNTLNSVPIVNDELVVVVPYNSPLNRIDGLTLEMLKDQRLIMLGPEHSLSHEIVSCCEAVGFTPDIVMTSSEVDFILNMVRRGIGITIQSRIITNAANSHDLAMVPLDHGIHRWDIHMVYPKRDLTQIENLFLKHVQDSFSGNTADRLSDTLSLKYEGDALL